VLAANASAQGLAHEFAYRCLFLFGATFESILEFRRHPDRNNLSPYAASSLQLGRQSRRVVTPLGLVRQALEVRIGQDSTAGSPEFQASGFGGEVCPHRISN
jgi:hypothetical protein